MYMNGHPLTVEITIQEKMTLSSILVVCAVILLKFGKLMASSTSYAFVDNCASATHRVSKGHDAFVTYNKETLPKSVCSILFRANASLEGSFNTCVRSINYTITDCNIYLEISGGQKIQKSSCNDKFKKYCTKADTSLKITIANANNYTNAHAVLVVYLDSAQGFPFLIIVGVLSGLLFMGCMSSLASEAYKRYKQSTTTSPLTVSKPRVPQDEDTKSNPASPRGKAKDVADQMKAKITKAQKRLAAYNHFMKLKNKSKSSTSEENGPSPPGVKNNEKLILVFPVSDIYANVSLPELPSIPPPCYEDVLFEKPVYYPPEEEYEHPREHMYYPSEAEGETPRADVGYHPHEDSEIPREAVYYPREKCLS